MKYLSLSLLFLFSLSCSNSEKRNENPVQAHNDEKLYVEASLVACFTNYINPKDKKIYYLVDIKLVNNTSEDYEFYSLSCGSLVNVVSDTQQAEFLYHNCPDDFAVTIRLCPHQEYKLPAIMVSDKYNNMTNPSVRFGFIVDPPEKRFGRIIPMDNHAIIDKLKLMRQNRENIIWSEPVMLSSKSGSNPYEIRSSLRE